MNIVKYIYANVPLGIIGTISKQSVERISNYIDNLPQNTQNVLFIPFDFRDNERYFSEPGEITASMVFDRHRILNLIDYSEVFSGEHGTNYRDIINYAVDYEEDIV
ncbi:hypothetical protein ACOBV9_22405 (plasmid) [Pseudoalteromonas espejiana]